MSEQWKDIEGLEGRYQISNLGRVRSVGGVRDCSWRGVKYKRNHTGKLLKLKPCRTGYLGLNLGVNGCYLVHRLVAKAFVPGWFEGAQVNHKDENRHNNRAENLEWVTAMENMHYGNCQKKIREKIYKVPIEQYTLDGKLVATYASQKEAARALGVYNSNICHALDTDHTVGGFRFKRQRPQAPLPKSHPDL